MLLLKYVNWSIYFRSGKLLKLVDQFTSAITSHLLKVMSTYTQQKCGMLLTGH